MSNINEMNVGPRWYVAHTYSGYENKIKNSLENVIENKGLHDLFFDIMDNKRRDQILYGVKATHNDGWDSYIEFEAGHTYYTAIAGWDGIIGQNVIYKFTWTGDNFDKYFRDADSIISDGEDD